MTAAVLVTGAAGFVGSHLTALLRADGLDVVGWHRAGPTPAGAAGLQWAAVDLLDRAAVARELAALAPSAIYHLAGAAHVGQSWTASRETYEANVRATHHLFDGLRVAGLRPRVLVAGSATVYGPRDRPLVESDPLVPRSPYAVSKLAQEMLARHACDDGVPALIARAFNHIGPRQDPSYVASSIARQIAGMEAGRLDPVLAVGNLEPLRDLTDVRDTVRAYSAMMARATPGTPYNVCSGRALSIGALVQAFVSHARVPVAVVKDPARVRADDIAMLVGDHAKLTADTGWQPDTPIEQTIDDLLDYWRTQAGR